MTEIKKAVELITGERNFENIETDDLNAAITSIAAEIKKRENGWLVKNVSVTLLARIKKETQERAEGYKDYGAQHALQGLVRWIEEEEKKL